MKWNKEMRSQVTRRALALILAAGLVVPGTGFAASTVVPDVSSQEKLEEFLRAYIKENFVGTIDDEKLNLYNNKGLFESLDPYSAYFTPEEYKSFNETMSGEFYGIGVHIESFNKLIRVVTPIEGSPAFKAGLEAGDLITKVDGEDVTKRTLQENVNKIKGPEGTKVILTVLKAKTGKEVKLTLTRAKITVKMVETKNLDKGVGYLKLSEFGDNSATEFMKGVAALDSKGATSLVIDLRNNPGGRLDQVIQIAEFLCYKGSEIINIDYKSEEDYKHIDENSGYNKPVVVLINKSSASASEILAAAIKENKRGTVIGETSYGKGTVQNLMGLSNGSGVKLTIAEYYGPKMLKINGIGVKPNLEVAASIQENVADLEHRAPFLDAKTYKLGDQNLDVYAAQQRLKSLGYESPLTAKIDTKMSGSLKAFQTKVGLKATGQLDYLTKKALEEKAKQLYTRMTSDLVLNKAIEVLLSK